MKAMTPKTVLNQFDTHNCYRLYATVLVMTVLLIGSSLGCSDDSDDSDDSNGGSNIPTAGAPAHTDPEGADLSDLKPTSLEVDPLDRVEVTGLPDDISSQDLWIEYAVTSGGIEREDEGEDDTEELGVMPLVSLDETVYLLTPLLDPEGSTIVLTMTDGASHSEGFELTIAALPPPREGAVDELEVAMERLVAATTEAMELDYPDEWEHWRAEGLEEMPEYLLPAMRSWLTVADETNDSAWVNQDFDDDTRTLLERLLAAQPIIEAVNGQAELIEEGDSLLEYAASTPAPSTEVVGSVQSAQSGLGSDGESRWEMPGRVTIQDAYDLENWIEEYNTVVDIQQKAEMFDETVGTVLSIAALIASAPSGGAGAVAMTQVRRQLMNAAISMVSIIAGTAGIARWFLPCCIVDLDTTISPLDGEIHHEDAEENQVSLVSARASAESEGVNLTEEILSLVMDEIGELLDNPMSDEFDNFVDDQVSDAVFDYASSELIEGFFDQFPPGSEMVFYWNHIDMMIDGPAQWLEPEIDVYGSGGTGPIFELATGTEEDPSLEFRLRAPQAFYRSDSLLAFTTRYDVFETKRAGDTHEIDFNYIRVAFDPAWYRVDDDDITIPFAVQVYNSALFAEDAPFIDTELRLEPDIGEVEYQSTDEATGRVYFHYLVPDDFPDDQIVEIYAESTTETGIRDPANNPPTREGKMLITADPDLVEFLDIQPSADCIDGGDTHQFEAVNILSEEPPEVTWEVDEGTISDSGLYTAPDGATEATIRATLIEDPDRSATADIIVDQCDCWWRGFLSGPDGGTDYGFTALLRYDEDEDHYYRLTLYSEKFSNSQVDIDFLQPLVLGDTESLEAELRTNLFADTFMGSSGGTDEAPDGQYLEAPPLTMDLTRNEPVESAGDEHTINLQGTLQGAVVVDTGLTGIWDAKNAHLSLEFEMPFQEPPMGVGGGDQLNCQPLNHPPVGYDD